MKVSVDITDDLERAIRRFIKPLEVRHLDWMFGPYGEAKLTGLVTASVGRSFNITVHVVEYDSVEDKVIQLAFLFIDAARNRAVK